MAGLTISRDLFFSKYYDFAMECADNTLAGFVKKNGAINGKKRSIPILQFTKDGELVKEWPSLSEAYRQLGILQSTICDCLKGRYKTAGGFVWRYAHGRR